MDTARPWQIEVSHSCVGSGQCTAAAPGHFRLVDGHSVPVAQNVAADDAVMGAAELCPVGAITVRDRETGRVFILGEN